MAEEPNDAFLEIATGAQNVGKTYETFKEVLRLAYDANMPLNSRKKALFFDSNGGEYSQKKIGETVHKIKSIQHTDIVAYGNFRGFEVRRIAPFLPNGHPMPPEQVISLLHRVTTEYRNGILVVEDFTTLVGDHIDDTTAGYLCNVRHRGTTLILHLQSLDAILPKMRRNVKIIRMHYQLDSVAQTKHKLKDEFEIFAIAEKLINKQYLSGNIHFFVYVYRMIKKIKGAFSNKMFSDAIIEYINENPRVIKQLKDTVNLRGKKVYTHEQAVMVKVTELFHKYNGNIHK